MRTGTENEYSVSSRQICQETWGIVTSRDWRASVSVIALTLLAAACGTPLTWWLSPTGRNHPLAETIWDVRADGFVTPSDLAGRLAACWASGTTIPSTTPSRPACCAG